MAKIKKKSEKVQTKKHDAVKKSVNPFEVHINKQKYQVLGQKIKNDRGLPGVSRAKAIKKRIRTLLPEYNVKNKSNKFLDRRIGEKNFSLSEEDRIMARFTAERMKHHNKKSIFNLADDEILTHRGQTLNEIEKFDDPRSDDDDDEELDGRKSSGRLDDSFVGDAHFGGGILTKTGKEGAKSHKDLIEQLIAESKKRKAEKQKTKEQTLELTEKLDSEWKDLLPLVNKSRRTDEEIPNIRQKQDDYDKVMRELKFEARGHPTDRLKSEDEIAKEEKERLEKLEQDRLHRMNGFTEARNARKQHRSADDLDDNFNYDSDPEEVTLAYDNDGRIKIDSEQLKGNVNSENINHDDVVEPETEIMSEEIVEEEEDNSEAETDDDLSDLKQSESDSDIGEYDEDKQENIVHKIETKCITINKNCTDQRDKSEKIMKTTTHDTTNKGLKTNTETKEKLKTNTKTKNEFKRKLEESINDTTDAKIQKVEENRPTDQSEENKPTDQSEENDVLVISEIMEKAKKELPYTYTLPDTYESLKSLLTNQPPEYQDVIIERMIKCNHPSLAAENKDNLGRLFVYLLQHLNDVAPENCDNDEDSMKHCFNVLNRLTPHLYNLAQLNPQNARDSLIEVIKEKQNEYKKGQKKYPGIEVLVFLKLISCLFSTSDFRHQVVTPSLVFISQMLTNCRIKSRYDISYGLFLVTLCSEYTSLSKRYMPAAIIYLMGIVHMAVPKLGVRLVKILPPFKPNCAGLVLVTRRNENKFDLKMTSEDFVQNKQIDEDFKLRTFHTTLKLAEELYENWNNLSSQVEIFYPFFKLLEMIPEKQYPAIIQDEIDRLKTIIETNTKNKKFDYIMYEKKKPKALRLYEPNIQKVYDYKRQKPMSKDKAEREKLLYKYKKEMKGAIREIRRDKSFLGRVKIKHQIQSDLERKDKVRQIYSEASIQQGELNALDRKKKRK